MRWQFYRGKDFPKLHRWRCASRKFASYPQSLKRQLPGARGRIPRDPFGRYAPNKYLVNKSAVFVHRLAILVNSVYKKAIFVHRILYHKKWQMPGANYSCNFERRALSLFYSLRKESYAVDRFIFQSLLDMHIHLRERETNPILRQLGEYCFVDVIHYIPVILLGHPAFHYVLNTAVFQ